MRPLVGDAISHRADWAVVPWKSTNFNFSLDYQSTHNLQSRWTLSLPLFLFLFFFFLFLILFLILIHSLTHSLSFSFSLSFFLSLHFLFYLKFRRQFIYSAYSPSLVSLFIIFPQDDTTSCKSCYAFWGCCLRADRGCSPSGSRAPGRTAAH